MASTANIFRFAKMDPIAHHSQFWVVRRSLTPSVGKSGKKHKVSIIGSFMIPVSLKTVQNYRL